LPENGEARRGAGVERRLVMLPHITLDNVNVHLAGRRLLEDVSWRLEAGTHWAFVGANGSGKSTLLRVIAGTQWIDADGGRRTYSPDGFGIDAPTRAAGWIRAVTAEQHERYVRLDLPLAGRAIIESGFDDSLYVHRPPTASESARVDALVEGLDLGPFVERPMRELSTGQVRRLLIARAIARAPRVLVLDEFTNGLDAQARRDVLALLDRIAESVTLVVASHRPADFPAAITQTAVVSGGRVGLPTPGRPPLHDRAAATAPRAAREPEPDVLIDIRGADVYRGHTLVLRDVCWRLRRGEHTAIRGANGAGKTTFAGLVAGTIPAATGARVERFGRTGAFNIWRLKERIAHVSDDVQIAYDMSDTVEAVVASGFPASIGLFTTPTVQQRTTVDDLIERFGLSGLRGRSLRELSFGERRKVLIARSLVRRPVIFILDEAWNGLDAAFRTALRALLTDLAATGTTLVTVAHDEDDDIVAALSPRVCSIEDGHVRTVDRAVNPQTAKTA
jgi:molybdate transport system ATP-binding protein